MMMQRCIVWFSLAAALLLAGCSTPATRVVLLPQPDGRPSAVVVKSNGGEVTLDKPYLRATVRTGHTSAPVLDQTDAARVRAENTMLFDFVPPAPQRYAVYFDAGNTSLMPESQREMTTALMVAMARTGSDIVITGFTDTVGAVVSNDELSLRRVRAPPAVQRTSIVTRRFRGSGESSAVGTASSRSPRPTASIRAAGNCLSMNI